MSGPGGDSVATDFAAEVVVVGSGAGGSVVASGLAEAGVDTLLLEDGVHHDPATFTQREDEMIRRLYQRSGQQFTADQSIVLMSGRGVGGSTVHNTALCVPPPAAILERWERLGGLPCPRSEFERTAASMMERLCAVVPDEDEINRNNRILRDGARALGIPSVVAHHNRLRCSGCGYCVLGCAYNRKRNVLFTHLEDGLRHGLRLRTGSRVERVRRAGAGFRVEGAGFRATCDRVVVAASALGTPALLRRSGLGPKRLVGRSLRLHPFAPVVGIFDEDVDSHRGIPQSVLVTGGARFLSGEPGGYVLMAAPGGTGATAALMPGAGAGLQQRMKLWRKLAVAGVLLHDESTGVVGARRDGHPSVRYWPSAFDEAQIREGVATLARIHFAAGAVRVLLPFRDLPEVSSPDALARIPRLRFRRYDVGLTSVHPQGSVPMGADPSVFPVASDGSLREAPGVHVADGSLFPTSVGVPPQVTIMTYASLVARGIAAALGRSTGAARPLSS